MRHQDRTVAVSVSDAGTVGDVVSAWAAKAPAGRGFAVSDAQVCTVEGRRLKLNAPVACLLEVWRRS